MRKKQEDRFAEGKMRKGGVKSKPATKPPKEFPQSLTLKDKFSKATEALLLSGYQIT